MGNKHDKMKLSVIFVLLLFFGSSIGVGILFLPSSTQDEDIELPTTIVVGNMDDITKNYIISNGGTIITFTYTPRCSQCYILLDRLKGSIQGLQPYAYIVYKEGEKVSILMENINGKKEITSAGLKDIVSFVCSTIPFQTPQYNRCLDLNVILEGKINISQYTNESS